MTPVIPPALNNPPNEALNNPPNAEASEDAAGVSGANIDTAKDEFWNNALNSNGPIEGVL